MTKLQRIIGQISEEMVSNEGYPDVIPFHYLEANLLSLLEIDLTMKPSGVGEPSDR